MGENLSRNRNFPIHFRQITFFMQIIYTTFAASERDNEYSK